MKKYQEARKEEIILQMFELKRDYKETEEYFF